MRNALGTAGLMLALAALAALAGCNNSGNSQNTADMRALHAVIDAEPLDVLVKDDVKVAGVALGTTSGYVNFPSGTNDTKVRSAANQSVLLDRSVVFGDGSRSTLLLHGKRNALNLLQLAEDPTAPSSGHTRVRAIGLSPDAGPVDLYLAAGDISTGPAAVAGVTYGAVTTPVEITSGSFRIVLTVAGTQDILFQSGAQGFAAGANLAVVVFPSFGGKLVNAVLLDQGAGSSGLFLANPIARVKAVSAVQGSVGLNFKVDGATLLSTVPFTGASTYVTTPSGSHSLQLEASNVPGTNVASLARQLDSARDYTVVAMGGLASPTLVALADDNTLPASGYSKVRFVNALADGSAVDALVNFAGQASGLAPGAASSYYQVAAGTGYTLTFASPGGINVLATLSAVELDASNVYTVYVFGTSSTAQARLVRDR
jgi:hypothetical protein